MQGILGNWGGVERSRDEVVSTLLKKAVPVIVTDSL